MAEAAQKASTARAPHLGPARQAASAASNLVGGTQGTAAQPAARPQAAARCTRRPCRRARMHHDSTQGASKPSGRRPDFRQRDPQRGGAGGRRLCRSGTVRPAILIRCSGHTAPKRPRRAAPWRTMRRPEKERRAHKDDFHPPRMRLCARIALPCRPPRESFPAHARRPRLSCGS